MRVTFVTVDVFTKTQFGGNPLAVVLNADGLSSGQMQAIANEFNLAETTFVLPPKLNTHTAEVRIFTPRAEVPFAGHPNVGTAYALAQAGECCGKKLVGDHFIFEEKAGLVHMELLRDGVTVSGARLAAPQPLSLGEDVSHADVAAAVSLPVDALETKNHKPIIASCGIPFVLVEVKSRAMLAAARPNDSVFATSFPMDRVTGIHLYTHVTDDGVDIQSRMFAPLYGVPEDPATGSANVALIGLLATLQGKDVKRFSRNIAQGVDMGRPSLMEATAEKKESIKTYIGGSCVPMMTGQLDMRSPR